MSVGIWFWILWVIALIFGFVPAPEGPNARYWGWGGHLLWFVLFFLVGLSLYGGPLKG